MPTPLGNTLPHTVARDSDTSHHSILPVHVAYRNETLERQAQRDQAIQGVQLQTLAPRKPEEYEEENTPQTLPTVDTRDLPEPSHFLSEDSEIEDDSPLKHQMTIKSRSANNHAPDRTRSSLSSETRRNGNANGTMNNHMEMRRKNPSLDSPTSASQTAHLMSRDDFSLDNQPPQTPTGKSTGFWDLPAQDRRNFLLLVLLYFLQGIPMGLASGSVPILLKAHLTYSQIGTFALAIYPYSLKLLWSPIVDAVWSRRFGRRKSWILPIQALSGLGMVYLGSRAREMILAAGANDGAGVGVFTLWWFGLVFMCATQDIAVDGKTCLFAMTHFQKCPLTEGSRLGSHTPFTPKLGICVDRTNCGSHGRLLSVKHCLLSI